MHVSTLPPFLCFCLPADSSWRIRRSACCPMPPHATQLYRHEVQRHVRTLETNEYLLVYWKKSGAEQLLLLGVLRQQQDTLLPSLAQIRASVPLANVRGPVRGPALMRAPAPHSPGLLRGTAIPPVGWEDASPVR